MSTQAKYDLKKVVGQFQIYGDFQEANPFGTGHINDTFLAKINQGGNVSYYIVQRINHNVFKKPREVMSNIFKVTNHIRKKLVAKGVTNASCRVLTFIPTKSNEEVYEDEDGNFWRAYIYIDYAHTIDMVKEPIHAYKSAFAFGEFQELLGDLPGTSLFDTIPKFHDGVDRYQKFMDALNADVKGRAALVQDEINFLKERAEMYKVLPTMIEKGEIPIRVTHNDCKINNVLLEDTTDDGICVIDLDTIMPGLALYDFGDMIRTSTNSGMEDEKDLTKIFCNIENFKAVAQGYLKAAGGFLTQAEKDKLVFSGKMITLIIGTRFLTDYLAGDVYFKIKYEDHNLVRCRTQLKLVKSIEENEQMMEDFIKSL